MHAPTAHTPRLFRNLEEIEKLSELGVLFLLFEMGLELSFDRLKVWVFFVGVFVGVVEWVCG